MTYKKNVRRSFIPEYYEMIIPTESGLVKQNFLSA